MKSSRQTKRASRKLFRASFANGVLDAGRARTITGQLADSGRRSAPRILREFARLVRLHRDRHVAIVETAAPLPDDVKQDVHASLARLYGSSLQTSFAENAALLGGMRIKVGSDVYDATLRGRLNAIAARF